MNTNQIKRHDQGKVITGSPSSRLVALWHGVTAILVGLLLILASAYWEATTYSRTYIQPTPQAAPTQPNPATQGPAQPAPMCTLMSSIRLTIQTIGIALLGFGLFGLLLDTRNWRNYFSKRIEEVVLEQSYLDKLDVDSLKGLQVKVLKAFFRDQTIDKEGSFLNYFQTNLHQYISDPYREDVTAEIELLDGGGDSLRIFDRVAYTCRKAGGSIQGFVSWIPDTGEYVAFETLVVRIKFPYYHDRKGQEEVLYDMSVQTGPDKKDLTQSAVHVSLEKFRDVDQLIVITEATYTILPERFQYWEMAHPTKNFTFIITHPRSYRLQVKPLVLDPENAQVSAKGLSTTVKYDSWMLPSSGLAWRFLRKPLADQTHEDTPQPADASPKPAV